MAAPTTPTTVTLRNSSGDTAMLVSSTYGGVPKAIQSGGESSEFQQDTSLNSFGSVVYAIGNIATWVVVWTANNQVAISILPAGAPIVWTDIWDKIQRDNAHDSYTTSYGWKYDSAARIESNGDAQVLIASIVALPPN
ncbi:uncharacterized protein LOC120176387 [Hibiscus syriacus]|uniref:uncharacterized protein LOC120176387 n=1 Tax=Hibiscus syriacus TaxID=106335 RepID=UPI0019227659|nr:uncharacterized protein LOC120176387 [Hibiscus syriacus]